MLLNFPPIAMIDVGGSGFHCGPNITLSSLHELYRFSVIYVLMNMN